MLEPRLTGIEGDTTMTHHFADVIEPLTTALSRHPLRTVATFAFGLWLFGLWLFVRSPREFHCVFPTRAVRPTELHNLVAFQYGPTLWASSFLSDKDSHHHPAFLIDGRARPSKVEKWVSRPDDERPWLQIQWQGKKQVRSVVITHAGEFERPELSARSYTLTCLRDGGTRQHWDIAQNRAHIAEHAVPCDGAVAIRIDFHDYGDMARVYEVEVWGQ